MMDMGTNLLDVRELDIVVARMVAVAMGDILWQCLGMGAECDILSRHLMGDITFIIWVKNMGDRSPGGFDDSVDESLGELFIFRHALGGLNFVEKFRNVNPIEMKKGLPRFFYTFDLMSVDIKIDGKSLKVIGFSGFDIESEVFEFGVHMKSPFSEADVGYPLDLNRKVEIGQKIFIQFME